MERILITGANGFIGRALVKALENGDSNTPREILVASTSTGINILDKNLVDKIEPVDIVVHLAGKSFVPESYNNPHDFYNTNVLGTLNILEFCRVTGAHLIYMGSYFYGNPKYLPIDELHPIQLLNPYANSKYIGEQLCNAYSNDFNLSISSLRLFNVFGPNQGNHFLIPKILDHAISGKHVKLGSLNARRDYIYIDDVVSAILALCVNKKKGFNVYNLGYGESFSVQEILNIVTEIFPQFTYEGDSEKRPNEIFETICDNSKIKQLNWSPLVTFKEGLIKIIENERNIS